MVTGGLLNFHTYRSIHTVKCLEVGNACSGIQVDVTYIRTYVTIHTYVWMSVREGEHFFFKLVISSGIFENFKNY